MAQRPKRPNPRPPAPASARDEVFAVVAPGLEGALVDELEAFGAEARPEPGGATFTADRRTLWALHLHGRVAGRYWVRVASFPAPSLEVLGERVRAASWDRFVFPRQPVEVRVTTHRSRLRHRETLARKVSLAIADAARVPRRTEGLRPPRTPVGVLVRIEDDRCVVSVDASGEHLHRRGWRTEAGEAPLRENLAAAVLWLARWRPGEALVDPTCGSGTFPIEAAGIASGAAPGRGRRFAFEGWPSHDEPGWKALLAEPDEPGVPTVIAGSDRDAGVVAIARANARRAGVQDLVAFSVADLRGLAPPAPGGLLVANPPYGERLPDAKAAWRALGDLLRGPFAAWRSAVLCPHPALLAAARLPGAPVTTFPNGGIRVTLHVHDPLGRSA